MAVLEEASGSGRGTLYNFFPAGKEEMPAAVLEDIDTWFLHGVFRPLRTARDAGRAPALESITTLLDTEASLPLSTEARSPSSAPL
jgi:hypothetical protein